MIRSARVRATVVIVNWNAGPALARCLDSLACDDVVVVDNASSDGSAAAVAERPGVRLVEAGANLGFAAGANLGASVAGGDPLVFVNPDAELRPGALLALTDALVVRPDVAVAGGGLESEDGRWQPGAARFAPLAHLLLDTTPGRLTARRRRAPYLVDWVYGTFMAVRRAAFTRLGGFDADYFLYGEDMDLCHRARALGLRTLHVPSAIAVHGDNLSARRRFGDGREAAVLAGEMRFYARRRGGFDLALFRAGAACKFGTKALLAAVTGHARARRTYGQVVRRCLTGAEA
jgi:GT2 family glycosyltransferase